MEHIAAWCAPWSALFDHSKLVSGLVTGLHIMALFVGGGLAIAADRQVLRVAASDFPARRRQLREVRSVHGIVLTGVIVLFISGALLAAADVRTFLPSPLFWIKLLFVTALIVNGALLTQAERRVSQSADTHAPIEDDTGWARIRFYSYLSVVLWSATGVVGIVLSSAA